MSLFQNGTKAALPFGVVHISVDHHTTTSNITRFVPTIANLASVHPVWATCAVTVGAKVFFKVMPLLVLTNATAKTDDLILKIHD